MKLDVLKSSVGKGKVKVKGNGLLKPFTVETELQAGVLKDNCKMLL